MDYSTISNKTNILEVEDITVGELSEKYYLLQKQYENLSSDYDAIKQELHDTKRNYQTALDIQSHLGAELENYQAKEKKRCNEFISRINTLQEEISALRQDRLDIVEQHLNEIKKLETENKHLKEEQETVTRSSPIKENNNEADDLRAALSCAVTEANDVKVELDVAKAEKISWQMKVEELVIQINEMRTTSDVRKEELIEAGEREAAALAELAEARALLHQVDSQDSQPHAVKGNSLFAEVDDKRQEMAKNLIQMKQTNARLKRDLANKQAELETLLHEKQTIWEQQAGAAAHYDRELVENYESRITQLEGMCEKQRRELCRWYNKLAESSEQAWLLGVLEHLKNECESLRAEVLCRGATQLASAVQVRELRRKRALLTSSTTTEQSPTTCDVNRDDIAMLKPIKHRPTADDTKKKVSFN